MQNENGVVSGEHTVKAAHIDPQATPLWELVLYYPDVKLTMDNTEWDRCGWRYRPSPEAILRLA